MSESSTSQGERQAKSQHTADANNGTVSRQTVSADYVRDRKKINPARLGWFPNFLSRCSQCGLVSALSLCLVAPIIVVINPYFAEHHSVGLKVRVVRDTPKFPANLVVLRIDGNNRLYVNSVPVSGEALKTELHRSVVLPFGSAVLIDGDPGADYQTVIAAVEAVRAIGAQPILLSKPSQQ
jgi:biopolymer transport protein ExbD